MPTLGLFGEPSELTVPGLATTGSGGSSVSLTPFGVKPAGSVPPNGPSGPKDWPGTGCSMPAFVSGSTSTSSAIAQLEFDVPETNPAKASALALAVVYAG